MLEEHGRASNDLFTNYKDGIEHYVASQPVLTLDEAKALCSENPDSIRLPVDSPDWAWDALALTIFGSRVIAEWATLIQTINYKYSKIHNAQHAIESVL